MIAAFYQTKIGESQTLTAYGKYKYSDNTYKRDYTEDEEIDVQSGAKERMNIFNAMIHHNVNFGAKHDFTIWLNDSYQNSDADYLKTSNPRQWLVDNNLLLCPVYMYKPIDRLAITMRTGLCWQKKKVN